jgi:MoxR-like ATPase
MSQLAAENDVAMVEKLRSAHQRLRKEIGKVIIGQEQVVDQLLMAIFCRSHALLMGVPGLAKTLMVSTLAQALDLSFKRVQFTPDLMPSDITGSEVIQDDPVTRERMFKFLPGPIFANIVLADEINRTPPKTQAALLEAMQERKASIGGVDHPMRNPFFVLATQNPIEQEGTYPLPEAQLDRFLFLIKVDYPTDEEEEQIMRIGTSDTKANVSSVLTGEDIHRVAAGRPPGAGVGQGLPLRQADHPVEPAEHPGSSRVREQVADLGRGAAGEHEPDPGSQGPRPAAGQQPRGRRRRGRGGHADPPAPAHPELRRAERGGHHRRGDPPAHQGRCSRCGGLMMHRTSSRRLSTISCHWPLRSHESSQV